MLKNKEDELVAHQTDIQKQREKMSQLDQDLIMKQNTVQALQAETFEVAKQKQEYAEMASQLEHRLTAVTGELEKARQNQGLKDTIKELEGKVKDAENMTKVAQEQKAEISEHANKMVKEKKQAQEELKRARELLEAAEKKYIDNSGKIGEVYTQIEQLKETIEEQKRALIEAHKENDTTSRQLEVFRKQVELINNEFGGINSVKEQIQIAKLKEQSVGDLWRKLDTCIVSRIYQT